MTVSAPANPNALMPTVSPLLTVNGLDAIAAVVASIIALPMTLTSIVIYPIITQIKKPALGEQTLIFGYFPPHL